MKKRLPSLEQAVIINARGANKLNSHWFTILRATNVQKNAIIIGIDEVGRGPVFGPMIIAGCVNLTGWFMPGIKDSKLIKDENTRKALAGEIQHNTVWATAVVTAEVINRFGTIRSLITAGEKVATELVARVRKHVPDRPVQVIFDGRDHAARVEDGCSFQSIEKADATIYEVSCASIVAKALHDSMINEILRSDEKYRRYDLVNNRGYGTPKHKTALTMYGMTEQHRVEACKTFLEDRTNAKARKSAAAGRIPGPVFDTPTAVSA